MNQARVAASTVLLAMVFGFLLLLLFLCAPPARAGKWWPKLEGRGYTLEVRTTPLETIPINPDAAGDKAMRWASLQALGGNESNLWRYLQDGQDATEWFLVKIRRAGAPSFQWSAGDRLYFLLSDSTRVPARVVTATICDAVDAPCFLQRMPVDLEWHAFESAGGWQAYAGAPRDAIRSRGVVGVSLEVSP